MPPPPAVPLTLVAAISEDGIIGTGAGGIPWKLPRDAAHFRATVAGRTLLLGRKTYDEMTAWFRDERPIVLSSDPTFRPREESARVASSLAEAQCLAAGDGAPELLVCGGASVYALALPPASRLILTHVAARLAERYPQGARFPDFDPAEWNLEREEAFPADASNAHAFRIRWYRRQIAPT